MNDRLIFAARLSSMHFTSRHHLFHSATFCFAKKGQVLNMTTAKVKPHHETSTGEHHQDCKKDRCYGLNRSHLYLKCNGFTTVRIYEIDKIRYKIHPFTYKIDPKGI